MEVARTRGLARIAAVILLASMSETCLVRYSPRQQLPKHASLPETDELSTLDFLRWHGYPGEQHVVTSEDGYMTTLHRLPYSNKSPNRKGRPAVLLYHPIFCTGDVWLMSGPEKGLGFLLVNSGYDVWLANTRGNAYSRKHITLSPEQPQYWNFSFHEMSLYDVPANIDYILAETGQKQLYIIHHSFGGTVVLAMATMRPEYNSKVRLMVALSPAIFLAHVPHQIEMIIHKYHDTIIRIYNSTKTFEMFPFNKHVSADLIQFCTSTAKREALCKRLLLPGLSDHQFNKTILPNVFGHFPGGTSVKTFEHLTQLLITGKFSEYNHKAFGKLKLYLNSNTKDYNLSLATIPTVIYYSKNDSFVQPKGILQLAKAIPNVEKIFEIQEETFGHMDFIFGKNAKSIIYNSIIKFMKKY